MSKTPRFTYETVVRLFEDNGAEFLDEHYGNQHTIHNFRCSCGKVSKTRVSIFKKSGHCRDCSYVKRAKDKSLGIESARQIFEDLGYKLLSETYHNTDTYMDCLCICGMEARMSVSGIRSGIRCAECVKKRFTGENNPRWNPELTDEERMVNRDYAEYLEWRKKVRENFGYMCYLCGHNGSGLEAHHIEPYSISKHLRTEVSNGILLCRTCHSDIHNSFALDKLNFESFKEYEEYHFPDFEKELDYDPEEGFYYAVV